MPFASQSRLESGARCCRSLVSSPRASIVDLGLTVTPTHTLISWLLNEAMVNNADSILPPGSLSANNMITFCWFVSYLTSTGVQHVLHSSLVYGFPEGSFVAGLLGTYAGYSLALAASVPINAAMVGAGMTASQAWGSTLVLTGVANCGSSSEVAWSWLSRRVPANLTTPPTAAPTPPPRPPAAADFLLGALNKRLKTKEQ